MSETPLWAAYLEMVLGDGPTQARQQWVLLPPVPASIAPDGMMPLTTSSYFYRKQDRKNHRTAWKVNHLTTPAKRDALVQSIARAELNGWVARPLVTCQVDVLEMRDIAQSWKTPYRVLERCGRVAKLMHDYTI